MLGWNMGMKTLICQIFLAGPEEMNVRNERLKITRPTFQSGAGISQSV
jgi:hypothetical protein